MCQHILSINVDEFSIIRVILHITQDSAHSILCPGWLCHSRTKAIIFGWAKQVHVCVFVYACVCVSFCVLQRQSCDLIIKYKFAISIKNRPSVCRFSGQLLYTYVASYNILHWK